MAKARNPKRSRNAKKRSPSRIVSGGVLTHSDLEKAWRSGKIRFEPDIDRGQIGLSSIDLRIGYKVSRLKDAPGHIIQPAHGFDPEHLVEHDDLSVGPRRTIRLAPREFLVVFTKESIVVPRDLVAAVQGKSGVARAGLAVHITAPHIHPGFDGPIALEMYNHGPWELELVPGEDLVCQIIYYRVVSPVPEVVANALGSYVNQAKPFPRRRVGSARTSG